MPTKTQITTTAQTLPNTRLFNDILEATNNIPKAITIRSSGIKIDTCLRRRIGVTVKEITNTASGNRAKAEKKALALEGFLRAVTNPTTVKNTGINNKPQKSLTPLTSGAKPPIMPK
ncbi:hypothetical protein MUP38_00540 [Candidatus Bathyarchaeota archaeon]|nr:hypothetical protein [Candidatus Bathyarchaeota archaeon]